jgi:uridine kinase
MTVHDYAAIASEVKRSRAQCGDVRVIAIDGPAGSGKTTLAAGLARELKNCPVVHMDDLYNGWTQDLMVELGQRINQQVLQPISQGLTSNYQQFDWYKNSFTSQIEVPVHEFLILEGVGSASIVIADLITYLIWIEAKPDVVDERIVRRDGEAIRPHLLAWHAKEAHYFAEQETKRRADMLLSGD